MHSYLYNIALHPIREYNIDYQPSTGRAGRHCCSQSPTPEKIVWQLIPPPVSQFDANCYLYLSHASDLFDLAEYGGSLKSGFSRLQLERALVIGVRTDILFPLEQQRELAEGISAVCNRRTDYVS